jgi:glycerol-3-phosphate O-acyltransferase
VWALLLERTHPKLATDVIYVAGDRVVTDPLCKPFSMGRNLFCVHSKKRMDDQPELKAEKQRTNRRTVVEMSKALREVHRCKDWPLRCLKGPSSTISHSAGIQDGA